MDRFQSKYMTPEEVDNEYGIPINTLRTWRAQGRGPRYLKVGRRVKYRRDHVEGWMDAQVVLTSDDYLPRLDTRKK